MVDWIGDVSAKVFPILLPLLTAFLGAWWAGRTQRDTTQRMLEHQRILESEKHAHEREMKQHSTVRGNLELAYQELLALEQWAAKAWGDPGDRAAAVAATTYPPEIGKIRMYLDLIDAEDLLTSFAAMDARLREFVAAMWSSSVADPVTRGREIALVASSFDAHAKAIDAMKAGIRRHLAAKSDHNF